MMQATRTVWSAVSALLFMLLGAAGVHLVGVAYHAGVSAWDQSRPVWSVETVEIIDRKDHMLRVRIVGQKLRECVLLRTFSAAHYGDSSAAATDVFIHREDGTPVGAISRPLGRQDLGIFVLRNVPEEAVDVVINIEHACDGRIVLGTLAKVALTKPARKP